MDHEPLTLWLVANEWRKEPTFEPRPPEVLKELWCKRNKDTPTLTLDFVRMNIHGVFTDFITVQLIGEIDNYWHDMSIYSLSPKEFMEGEAKIIGSLTKSWLALK